MASLVKKMVIQIYLFSTKFLFQKIPLVNRVQIHLNVRTLSDCLVQEVNVSVQSIITGSLTWDVVCFNFLKK